MHSVRSPIEEATDLYVDQVDLPARLRAADGSPLVVWDVGLGAGANAMAALRAAEREKGTRRKLVIESFERDLDSLRLALLHHRAFPYLWHSGPSALLKNGLWEGDGVEWRLHPGEFQDRMAQARPPELIYFDPFSAKTEPSMWSIDLLEGLFSVLRAQKARGVLVTYSHSTAVRAALLAAGFDVAEGRSSGVKEATTLAFYGGLTEGEGLIGLTPRWLGPEWLERWTRSSQARPLGWAPEREGWRERIFNHPQFARARSRA
jgi:queuine tRNA-ribosyltransferase